ncbi:hypothetical protein AGLY_001065 [Aphis glycines]|uniref:Uncharacterized protein n=1 Tax=Aphis glycines TaxID=307491 RepID=A0A6G0UB28_APHGL|nr:hypothetical protein AGLY_001065 [Aphis glycines]
MSNLVGDNPFSLYPCSVTMMTRVLGIETYSKIALQIVNTVNLFYSNLIKSKERKNYCVKNDLVVGFIVSYFEWSKIKNLSNIYIPVDKNILQIVEIRFLMYVSELGTYLYFKRLQMSLNLTQYYNIMITYVFSEQNTQHNKEICLQNYNIKKNYCLYVTEITFGLNLEKVEEHKGSLEPHILNKELKNISQYENLFKKNIEKGRENLLYKPIPNICLKHHKWRINTFVLVLTRGYTAIVSNLITVFGVISFITCVANIWIMITRWRWRWFWASYNLIIEIDLYSKTFISLKII